MGSAMSGRKLALVGVAAATVVGVLLVREDDADIDEPPSGEERSVAAPTDAPRQPVAVAPDAGAHTPAAELPRPRVTLERPRLDGAPPGKPIVIGMEPALAAEVRAAREQLEAGDYAAAYASAKKLLDGKGAGEPMVVRIAVSAACAQKDRAAAEAAFADAQKSQQGSLVMYCSQFGIDPRPPAQKPPRRTP